jgi:hypothetical protein
MRTQSQMLAKLAKELKDEVQNMEYFDASRMNITDHVQLYANDKRDYVHVQFNKGGKTVDITVHEYSEAHYSETLNIDLSVSDVELNEIVKRSKGVVDQFKYIYSNIVNEIKEQKIAELELEISKLRGDVPVI